MRVLVTVSELILSPKGREQKKEIYLVAVARDAEGISQVETPTFYRVERALFLEGDGVEIYCDDPTDFLQIFLSVVESDSDVRSLGQRIGSIGDAVNKLPLPQAHLASMATSLISGVLVSNKDDTLYTAAFCVRADRIQAGDVGLPSNDRVDKITLRLGILGEENVGTGRAGIASDPDAAS